MQSFNGHGTMRNLHKVLCLAGLLSTILVPAAAGDSLAAGQSISGNETLVSAEGSFVLGFFSTPRWGHRYLGIWYSRIPDRTVVWVANRQRPLPGSAGSLNMSRDGSVVLSDATGSIYWSADPEGDTKRPVLRLLDNGNLVVLDERSNSYVWQSFAHPTDTLLPGMRLGLNRRTGERIDITGWRGEEDPAPGDYSCGLDTRGVPQVFVRNGSTPLWRGGPWIGERFMGIPAMKANWPNFMFSYNFISNPDVYFEYGVWNKSTVTRVTMNSSGFAEHLVWDYASSSWTSLWASSNGTCDRIDACGFYGICDSSKSPAVCSCPEGFEPRKQQDGRMGVEAAGCKRRTPLRCGKGKDAFVVVAGAKLPDTSSATKDDGIDFDHCKERCLSNCSCTAFASSDGSGCISWFGNLTDIALFGSSGLDLYVRVAATGPGGRDKKEKIIIIILPIIFFLAILLVLFYLHRRRKINRKRLRDTQHGAEKWDHGECVAGNDFELPLFHLSTIESATNNFSSQNKLGEGGYGPVYKGMLPDGQYIAVKRLSKDSRQGMEQFKSEVQLVAKLQHTNLVRLLGYCIEKEEKLLVYEYMPNQSLDKFIFDVNKGRELDWTKRLHIIEGITQGLLYLHNYSRLRVIHRDLKASNILLDDECNPKISDFGLARIFSWNEPQANTKHIVGTYGYMPPEYAMKGLFSVKSDVFSFGVLLLEILSGKRNTSINHFGLSQNLPGYAWDLWHKDRALELIDSTMGNAFSKNEFSRCINVALLCVQENPVDRPSMLDIVTMLNNKNASLPIPNKPAFFLVRHTIEENNNFDREHFSFSNDVTISRIEGR